MMTDDERPRLTRIAIVMSAAEARMRDYDMIVPCDCVDAPSGKRSASA